MSEIYKEQNHDLLSEKEYLHSKVQGIIDDYAKFFCPAKRKSDYENYKNETPEERLATFRTLVKGIDRMTLDLVEAHTDSPKALMGSFEAQEELMDALLTNGYERIDVLQRVENNRNISIRPIFDSENRLSKNYYLFTRDRIIWKCAKNGVDDGGGNLDTESEDETEYDYVVKRSHFIAAEDDDFMRQLDIDTRFPPLSPEKTELCEKLLDSDDSYVEPHSVLYYIKSGKPDKIKPRFTKPAIKDALDYVHGRKNEKMNHKAMEIERNRPKKNPDGLLHIDQGDD